MPVCPLPATHPSLPPPCLLLASPPRLRAPAAFPTIPLDTPPFVRLGRLLGFLQNQTLFDFPALASPAQLPAFLACAAEVVHLHHTHGWMRHMP